MRKTQVPQLGHLEHGSLPIGQLDQVDGIIHAICQFGVSLDFRLPAEMSSDKGLNSFERDRGFGESVHS